jgi:hypothetical protein
VIVRVHDSLLYECKPGPVDTSKYLEREYRRTLLARVLVAAGSDGIRLGPLNENSGIPAVPGWTPLLRRNKVEESPNSVEGIGTADTTEIIKANTSATRPARERIFEYCMIADQPIGECGEKHWILKWL